MSKVVAIMSMSLDGFVADPKDGVAEVFDWYFNSGDVEIHTGGSDPMTFKVSAPSAEHLRGLWSAISPQKGARIWQHGNTKAEPHPRREPGPHPASRVGGLEAGD